MKLSSAIEGRCSYCQPYSYIKRLRRVKHEELVHRIEHFKHPHALRRRLIRSQLLQYLEDAFQGYSYEYFSF